MTAWLMLGALVAAVATMQAVLCALVLAAGMRWLKPWLTRAAMSGQLRPLIAVAALPALSSSVLVAACMAPSMLVSLGLVGDHCVVHIDHALHLCVHHLPNVGPTVAVALSVTACAFLAGSAFWRAGKLMVSGRAEAASLAGIAEQRDDVSWIESRVPLALTVGLLRPRVYVSSGLAGGLDPVELDAAIAHERCHARERHALLKMLVAISAMFHLPAMRRELLSLIDLACERRADESAADAVTDRLRVASALVRAHRLGNSAPALAFADGPRTRLDRRVRALIEERTHTRHPAWPTYAIAVGVILAAAANHELHHAAEHVLALLV